MSFDLANYEPVEDRLERFHKDYKEGRVVTELVSNLGNTVMFKAYLYRSFDEEKAWATGFAEETKGENGPVNKYSHVENCETSAIGRALANAGYAPKGARPSREEMAKVQKAEQAETKPFDSTPSDPTELNKEIKRLYAIIYERKQSPKVIIPKLETMMGRKLSMWNAGEIRDQADKLMNASKSEDAS